MGHTFLSWTVARRKQLVRWYRAWPLPPRGSPPSIDVAVVDRAGRQDTRVGVAPCAHGCASATIVTPYHRPGAAPLSVPVRCPVCGEALPLNTNNHATNPRNYPRKYVRPARTASGTHGRIAASVP